MQQEPSQKPPADLLTNGNETEITLPESQQAASDRAWQLEAIQRSIAGDESAFALIIEQYSNLLLRTAYLLVEDEELSKDIVQEALILAWKNLKHLREPTYLRAWLVKITVNQSMSFKRQLVRKATLFREQFLPRAIDLSAYQYDAERTHIENTVDIMQAMSLLPPNQRIVLILVYYHNMTMPEISSVLSVSENTLRKRLQAALQKMRRALHVENNDQQGYNRSEDHLHSRVGIRRGGAS